MHACISSNKLITKPVHIVGGNLKKIINHLNKLTHLLLTYIYLTFSNTLLYRMFKYYSVIVYLCECKAQIQMIMHACMQMVKAVFVYTKSKSNVGLL